MCTNVRSSPCTPQPNSSPLHFRRSPQLGTRCAKERPSPLFFVSSTENKGCVPGDGERPTESRFDLRYRQSEHRAETEVQPAHQGFSAAAAPLPPDSLCLRGTPPLSQVPRPALWPTVLQRKWKLRLESAVLLMMKLGSLRSY